MKPSAASPQTTGLTAGPQVVSASVSEDGQPGAAELTQYTGLLDVRTGELLPATVDNAARVIHAARALKNQATEIVNEATAYLVEESTRQGIKTLHGSDETVTVSGGPSVDYDPAELRDNLLEAGCPQNRIDRAVVTEVTYKVDRAVLRQLSAANPVYRRAIEGAEIEVEKPYRASVKLRRQTHEDE